MFVWSAHSEVTDTIQHFHPITSRHAIQMLVIYINQKLINHTAIQKSLEFICFIFVYFYRLFDRGVVQSSSFILLPRGLKLYKKKFMILRWLWEGNVWLLSDNSHIHCYRYIFSIIKFMTLKKWRILNENYQNSINTQYSKVHIHNLLNL